MAKTYKPIVLIIIDGWGLSPSWGGNAIVMNNPQFINWLWRRYPHKILQAFGEIAKPYTKVGNSEIGHAAIGSGRLILPDLNEITISIKGGQFFKNPELLAACKNCTTHNSSLHLIGMVSDGSIHSHIDHLFALLDLAQQQGLKRVYIHMITDGQDTNATQALVFLKQLEEKINQLQLGEIATVVGRFYAMDRDNHWDRIDKAYKAMVLNQGLKAQSAKETIKKSYLQGITDIYIPPTVIFKNGAPVAKISDKDSVIFFNFRADRGRQLTRAFTDSSTFRSFPFARRYKLLDINFVTLTSYGLKLPIQVAFKPAKIPKTLAEVLSESGFSQLHVAESEKYAHVTYFFNGGREELFKGEDRIIVKSPDVDRPDKAPKLGTPKIVEVVLKNLKDYDFMVINLSNADLLGHTGNIVAIGEGVRTIDQAIRAITLATLKAGGAVIITADHGNAEQVVHIREEGDPETLHTLNPVPFILATPDSKKEEKLSVLPAGFNTLHEILMAKNNLADVAPTILELLGIEKPAEMTGESLTDILE